MVSALNSRAGGLGLSPGLGHSINQSINQSLFIEGNI